MSKRFGRNKRRALNATIKLLGEKIDKLENRVEHEKHANLYAKEAVRRTSEILGEYFAGISFEDITTIDERAAKYFMENTLRISRQQFAFDPCAGPEQFSKFRENLETKLTFCDVFSQLPQVQELRDVVEFYFMVPLEGEKMGLSMGLTQATVKHTPTDLLVDDITREFKKHLADEINKIKRGDHD